jgi:hypothetical protein
MRLCTAWGNHVYRALAFHLDAFFSAQARRGCFRCAYSVDSEKSRVEQLFGYLGKNKLRVVYF